MKIDNGEIIKEIQTNNNQIKVLCKTIFNLEKDLSKLNDVVVEILREYYRKEISAYNKANNIINEYFDDDDD